MRIKELFASILSKNWVSLCESAKWNRSLETNAEWVTFPEHMVQKPETHMTTRRPSVHRTEVLILSHPEY